MDKLTIYEKSIVQKLGAWVVIWKPQSPKTYGLYFFRHFLESENAWNKFIINFYSIEKRKGFVQMFEYIWASKDITNLLQWAFDWDKTKEGKEYWSNIDDGLKRFITKKKNGGYDFKSFIPNELKKTTLLPLLPSRPLQKIGFPTTYRNNVFVNPSFAFHKLPFNVPISSTTIVSLNKLITST